jgi:hypothetical protein
MLPNWVLAEAPNFIAIADGDYYKSKDSNARVSKLDYLKGLANRRNTFALSINELNDFLNNI